MSDTLEDVGIDFFEDPEYNDALYPSFADRFSRIYENSSFAREGSFANGSQSNIKDCLLYMEVLSISLNTPRCEKKRLSLHVSAATLERRSFQLHSSNRKSSSDFMHEESVSFVTKPAVSGQSCVWEFADFYGMQSLDFTLEQTQLFGYKTKKLGEISIKLSDLLKHQASEEGKKFLKVSESPYLFDDFASRLCVEYEVPMAITVRKDRTWWQRRNGSREIVGTSRFAEDEARKLGRAKAAAAKKGTFRQDLKQFYADNTLSSSSASDAIQAVQSVSTQRPIGYMARIKLRFRVVHLSKCLVRSVHNWLPPWRQEIKGKSPTEPHEMTEFHLLAAYAPSGLLVEAMKILAWKSALSNVLSLASSGGLVALEYALLTGNSANVFEMLQRTGRLCFPSLVANRSSVFHCAVVSRNSFSLDCLCRYLRKYGPNSYASRGTQDHLTLSVLIEWKDGLGLTPLHRACMHTPEDIKVVEYLLLAGADISSVHTASHRTALMYACAAGATHTVNTLLSVVKSDSELYETWEGLNGPSVTSNHVSSSSSDALSRHLRSNARSRRILRGRNPLQGGFFNPLALYPCNPSQREIQTGRQAIHIAVRQQHIDIVLALLQVGVSLIETDTENENIFHAVCRNLDVVSWAQLLPFEERRWQIYAQQARSRALDLMYQPYLPLLGRNCRGENCLDLVLEHCFADLTAATSPTTVETNKSKTRRIKRRENARNFLLQVVEAMLSVYDDETLGADNRCILLSLQECFTQFGYSVNSGTQTSSNASAHQEETFSLSHWLLNVARQTRKDFAVLYPEACTTTAETTGSNVDADFHVKGDVTAVESLASMRVPATILGLALRTQILRQLRRSLALLRLVQSSEDLTDADVTASSPKAEAVSNHSAPVVEASLDSHAQAKTSNGLPEYRDRHEKVEEDEKKASSSSSSSDLLRSSKKIEHSNGLVPNGHEQHRHCDDTFDERWLWQSDDWRVHDLADNVDYNFALSALTLKYLDYTQSMIGNDTS